MFFLQLVGFFNLSLFLFNMLPVYPLDGGQMLQAILWPHMGYYRSMNFACVTGMAGGIFMGLVGLVTVALVPEIAMRRVGPALARLAWWRKRG